MTAEAGADVKEDLGHQVRFLPVFYPTRHILGCQSKPIKQDLQGRLHLMVGVNVAVRQSLSDVNQVHLDLVFRPI